MEMTDETIILMSLALLEFIGFIAISLFYWWLFRPYFQAQLKERIPQTKAYWRQKLGIEGKDPVGTDKEGYIEPPTT